MDKTTETTKEEEEVKREVDDKETIRILDRLVHDFGKQKDKILTLDYTIEDFGIIDEHDKTKLHTLTTLIEYLPYMELEGKYEKLFVYSIVKKDNKFKIIGEYRG